MRHDIGIALWVCESCDVLVTADVNEGEIPFQCPLRFQRLLQQEISNPFLKHFDDKCILPKVSQLPLFHGCQSNGGTGWVVFLWWFVITNSSLWRVSSQMAFCITLKDNSGLFLCSVSLYDNPPWGQGYPLSRALWLGFLRFLRCTSGKESSSSSSSMSSPSKFSSLFDLFIFFLE